MNIQARIVPLTRVALVALAVAVAFNPAFVQAAPLFQEGNPFASPGAQTGALSFINSLIFWIWILMALGGLAWVGAYFAQPILPNLYNQMRDYVRTGLIIAVVFQFVLNMILAQAQAAQGGGSEGAAPSRQHIASVISRNL